MVLAGIPQVLKVSIGKVNMRFPQSRYEFCRSSSVVRIYRVVGPLQVVQKREQFHHVWIGTSQLGQPQAVVAHTRPV